VQQIGGGQTAERARDLGERRAIRWLEIAWNRDRPAVGGRQHGPQQPPEQASAETLIHDHRRAGEERRHAVLEAMRDDQKGRFGDRRRREPQADHLCALGVGSRGLLRARLRQKRMNA